MQVTFSSEAKADLDYWRKNNKANANKVLLLIKAIEQDPYNGIGKPEPLK